MTEQMQKATRLRELVDALSPCRLRGYEFVIELWATYSGAGKMPAEDLRAMYEALDPVGRGEVLALAQTDPLFSNALVALLGPAITRQLDAITDSVMSRIGFDVMLGNILVGLVESVLLEKNLEDWPRLLLHATTEVIRIHSRDPEAQLAALSAGLLAAMPEVKRQVDERESRYDAADGVLEALPAEQREPLRQAHGW